jgi:hypothetical protein
MRAAAILAALTLSAHAQWTIQQSNTIADLRGIDNVGHGIAWASGTNGTVLHTTDNGATWLLCKTPPDAEHLDFRGIQAFDANTAIVMSSGKGDLSRLYKTTDGCQTWKLVFTNPDKEGFWDAIQFSKNDPGINSGIVVGDPVAGKFPLRTITERFMTSAGHKDTPKANSGEAAFAASNTAIFVYGQTFLLGTGGSGGARVIRPAEHTHPTATAPPSPTTPPPKPGSPSAPTAPTSPPTTAATGARSNPPPPTPPTPTSTGTRSPCPSSSAPTAASACSTPPHSNPPSLNWRLANWRLETEQKRYLRSSLFASSLLALGSKLNKISLCSP